MRFAACVLLAALHAGPAFTQEVVDDWDLTTDTGQQLTLATLNFGTNQIALRCRAGALDLMLTGVPPTDAALRPVRVTAGPIHDERQLWFTWSGRPIASSGEPERLARQLRAGGELDIVLEGTAPGERSHRYRLPVPSSATSVDRVLTACSAPLSDEWDLRPRAEPGLIVWASQPRPDFPSLAMERGLEQAEVRLVCLVAAEGALDDCRILSETPAGAGFGRSAQRSAERARLGLPEDEGSVIGKVISFTIRFRAS
ncbi:MAG: energy transducer TonB [Brevundimonas sp.]